MGYVLIEYLLTHASQRSPYNALHVIAVRTKFQPDKEVVVRTTSRIGKFGQKVTTALQVVPIHEHAHARRLDARYLSQRLCMLPGSAKC